MSYKIMMTTEKVATARDVDPDTALSAAQAEWDSGKWRSVRVLTDSGAPYWKRGTGPSSAAEVQERAELSRAAGLTHLSLDAPEIGGLADLGRPIEPNVGSLEVYSDLSGVHGVLYAEGIPPSVSDLLSFVDHRLTKPATLKGWRLEPAPGFNPAHGRLTVEVLPQGAST